MFIEPDHLQSTGNPVLDAAHERLARVVNQAYGMWTGGESAERVSEVLGQLVDMARRHFDDELAVLRTAGYPQWEEHQSLHQRLVADMVAAFSKKAAGDPRMAQLDMFKVIDRLLYEHEFLDDLAFAPVFDAALGVHVPPLVEWEDQYSVGDDNIDRQHKVLVKRLNLMEGVAKSGAGRDELVREMEGLFEYVSWHFAYEEELMRSRAMPFLTVHKMLHDTLRQQLRTIIEEVRTGKTPDLVKLVQDRLKTWLVDHMHHMDTRIGEFLASHGA